MESLEKTRPVSVTDDDLFLLTSASPETTGLPFFVWFSCWPLREGQEPRIWVSETGLGDKFMAAVTAASNPATVEGHLADRDLHLLGRWIDLNLPVILRHWGDFGQTFDSLDALGALRPLPR